MNEAYLCTKTYEDDDYGIDFLNGKIYYYKDGYMHSTENGTSVMIEEDELRENWEKIINN